MKISKVIGREILDSRGNPTTEADVILENGIVGRAAVPSGASTGTNEAVELRDGDKSRFLGKGTLQAAKNINTEIAEAVQGMETEEQSKLDARLRELDGTPNKARLGANAILAVSLAAAKAAALSAQKPLYEYVHELSGNTQPYKTPVPLMNIINGGKHAAGSTDIQEFMVVPVGAKNFHEAVRYGAEIFHALAAVLKKNGYGTTVGDEGGYAPHVKAGNAEALDLINQAVTDAGYTIGKDIVLALDVAASELYQNNTYQLATENRSLSTSEMVAWLQSLAEKYSITSIEDGLSEGDWDGWKQLTTESGSKLQIVGDDLLVTNTQFLQRAITEKAANAILVKPNQIGTLSETMEAVALAHTNGWQTVMSHRSGETEDTTIAHLALGLGSSQIKTGSLSRTDRVAKYNEIMRIEEALGDAVTYSGPSVFTR